MGKLISLDEKREKWTTTYSSFDGRLKISVSNHGRLSFQTSQNAKAVVLDFFDSVDLVTKMMKDMNLT